MSGWLTNGMPLGVLLTGNEAVPYDSDGANGVAPQSGALSLLQLSNIISQLNNGLSVAPVSGTRFYTSYPIGGDPNTTTQLTGIAVHVGTTGGTDKWIVELHDSTGALLATSALAGVTVSTTAGLWQQFPFTAKFSAAPGNYFIAVQSNGTTALLDTYNYATAPGGIVTGSATGVFGTSASITPPTTYTAALGPKATVY